MKLDANNKLSLKNRIILINLVLLGAAAGLVYFLILPNLSSIKEAKDEIDSRYADLEQKHQRSLSLRNQGGDLNKIEPEINRLEKMFVQKDKEVEFIAGLEQLAAAHSLTQKISLGTPQKGGASYSKTPMQILIQGKYRDCLDYLKGLKTMGYQINPESVEISGGSSSEDGASAVSMNLAVETYWR